MNHAIQRFVQSQRAAFKAVFTCVTLQSDIQSMQIFSGLADAKAVQKRFPEMPLIWLGVNFYMLGFEQTRLIKSSYCIG